MESDSTFFCTDNNVDSLPTAKNVFGCVEQSLGKHTKLLI